MSAGNPRSPQGVRLEIPALVLEASSCPLQNTRGLKGAVRDRGARDGSPGCASNGVHEGLGGSRDIADPLRICLVLSR